ncbi:MAG: hypothetical protein P8X74_21465 [Reinekea sp.]
MGGINPPPDNSHEFLELSQNQSRLLFLCASEFYKAHVEIEDAVIAETRGEDKVLNLFDIASRRFSKLCLLIDKHSKILFECRSEALYSERWLVYLDMQVSIFEQLSNISQEIVQAVSSVSIAKAIAAGSLQNSMFYDAENSKVRELSVKFSNLLLVSLHLHDEFVANENYVTKVRVV